MKIVIVAGGTGSIALQTGLHHLLKDRTDDLEIKVLVNAYDNGLSTGAVRKVLGGHILGPSDVRKNQTTRYGLIVGKRTPLLGFLDHRFTAPSAEAEKYALDFLRQCQVDGLEGHLEGNPNETLLRNAIKAFFSVPLATRIDYSDFSVANIVYAGLAAQNGNSLRAAARIMSKVLGIEDNVILNDDTSLFLGAITKSGLRITDEGDIVSWNNSEDPFVDLFFTDALGNEKMPILCDEAKRALLDADVIILSSGTQWSSLIPTYASAGFAQAVNQTRAKILMVMNRVPDKDAPSQGADDIVNLIIPKYFPTGKVDLIVDSTSQELMNSVTAETSREVLRSINSFALHDHYNPNNKKTHDPMKLALAVCRTIYRDYLDAASFMFDFDDTLVGRGHSYPKASEFNRQQVRTLADRNTLTAVCTGNSIKAIDLEPRGSDLYCPTSITIFADGGINKYEYNPTARSIDEEAKPFKILECLVPAAQFARSGSKSVSSILQALRLGGIPTAKIENRGDVMLTIKPVDPEYREIVRNLALRILKEAGFNLKVKSAGRTSIEIASDLVSKDAAVYHMLANLDVDQNLVFVGDEFESGNDASVLRLAETDKRIKCLRVKNPTDTAIFFTALHGI